MDSLSSPKQKSFSLRKRFESFKYAFNGLKILIKTEHNSRIHVVAVVIVNIIGFYLNFVTFEWIAVWLCIGFVFMTEIFNTAIESLCDHISMAKKPAIGRVKDLAAGGVLIAAFTSVIVMSFIVINRYLALSLVGN